jgi:hypothetical protein
MNLCVQLGLNGHITLFLDYRNNYNIGRFIREYHLSTNMLHVYKHINTQKSPTFNSNVHFLFLFLGFSIQQKLVRTKWSYHLIPRLS